jgi:hypothetical protein
MADLADKSTDVSIHNEATDAAVTTTTDGSKERLDVDALVSGGEVSATDHFEQEIHNGNAFIVSDYDTRNKNDEWDVLIKVDTLFAHLRFATSTNLGLVVELYESPTTTANGTLYTAYNRNRDSATLADTDVYDNPTVTSPGTLLVAIVVPGANQSGGAGGESNEIILDTGKDYLLRMTSQGNSNLYSWGVTWYEGATI